MQNMLLKLFPKGSSSSGMNLNSLQNKIEPVIEYLHSEGLRQDVSTGNDQGPVLSEIYGNSIIQGTAKYIPFF